MKKFYLACVGFALLCLAFACGQQAFKQPANAAGVQAGSQWVHATVITGGNAPYEQNQKVLLNLNYVEWIDSNGVAVTPLILDGASNPRQATFQIDTADIPK